MREVLTELRMVRSLGNNLVWADDRFSVCSTGVIQLAVAFPNHIKKERALYLYVDGS